MDQVERRRTPRVEANVPLRLTFQDATVETRIRDLSSSGIRFRGPSAHPLLSRVQIALQIPEADSTFAPTPIAISGVVVRCDETRPGGPAPFDTAIYFDDLSDRARAQLVQFVASQLPE